MSMEDIKLDVIQPRSIILPFKVTSSVASDLSGAIIISGGNLTFYNGTKWSVVTSS